MANSMSRYDIWATQAPPDPEFHPLPFSEVQKKEVVKMLEAQIAQDFDLYDQQGDLAEYFDRFKMLAREITDTVDLQDWLNIYNTCMVQEFKDPPYDLPEHTCDPDDMSRRCLAGEHDECHNVNKECHCGCHRKAR